MLSNLLRGNIDFIEAILYILSSLIVVFLTLPIHEFAHGYTATKLGDPTPRYQGRLTLNPFAHIDYIGALCIILFGFGWAKPVGVDQRYFKNPKRDMAITAFAGPVSNIIVAFIAFVLNNLFYLFYFKLEVSILIYVCMFFTYIAKINVYLAVFNLIPIPPLDGSRLLSALLPDKYYYKLMRYERYIFFGLLALLWIGVLDYPISFISGYVIEGVSFLASLPFKFF